jgi:hypothetical protein
VHNRTDTLADSDYDSISCAAKGPIRTAACPLHSRTWASNTHNVKGIRNKHALDHFCDLGGVVAPGDRDLLHDGWIHLLLVLAVVVLLIRVLQGRSVVD